MASTSRPTLVEAAREALRFLVMDYQHDARTQLVAALDAVTEPGSCVLCGSSVGNEWRGLYIGPTHTGCARDASRDG